MLACQVRVGHAFLFKPWRPSWVNRIRRQGHGGKKKKKKKKNKLLIDRYIEQTLGGEEEKG